MIDFGQVTIDGIEEAVIRDNVIGIDQDLLTRVIEQLVSPYRQATYQKAKAEWEKVAHELPVPPLSDVDAVIAWYIGRDGYKDADTIEAERVAAEVAAKIETIDAKIFDVQGRIEAVEANLAHEQTDPDSDKIDSLTAELAALTAEKESLEAEKAAL